jgi:hypothetical protein
MKYNTISTECHIFTALISIADRLKPEAAIRPQLANHRKEAAR